MEKTELKELLKEIKEEEKVEKESTAEGNVDVTKLADELGDRIAKAIVEAKGGNEKDQEDLKEKFFNPRNGFKAIEFPSNLSNLTKEEKVTTFFKALVAERHDPEAHQVLRALIEGTDSEGGYLVPEEFRAEVFRLLPDYSVMRKLARVIPMSTDTMNLNYLVAKPEAYWTAEYASKTTSSAEIGRKTLSPNKLVCLLPVTEELLADANIDVVNFIAELFAERIGEIEDKAYFTGTGTTQPWGLATRCKTVNVAGNDFDAIIDMIYYRGQAVRNSRRAAFVGNKNVIKAFRKVKDSDGRYIWSAGNPESGEPQRLYGYPLYEQNNLGQNTMFFGDFGGYVIGDRQQLTVRTTMDGGDAWRRDAMEIKAKIRVDGEVVLTNAFTRLSMV
jgi:HK97 family phage major capsid protein